MSILKSTMTVSGWTAISRVFGFIRDIVIANKLGASAASDAFFVALLIPNLLRRLLAEGGFGMAFIPLLSRLEEKDVNDGRRFVGAVIVWMLLLLVVLLVLGQFFMPQIVGLIAFDPRTNPEKFELAVLYGRITFPYLFFITIVGLLGGICNVRQQFAAFAFMPILLNVAFLACLFILPPMGVKPAMAASIAVPIGGVLQLICMIWAIWKLKYHLKITWPPRHPKLGSLMRRIGPAALTIGVLQISFLIDTKLASTVEIWVSGPHVTEQFGTYAVSYLNYANKFYQFPLALIGIAMATVLLPHFSRALEKNDIKQAKLSFEQCFIAGIALAASAMAGLMLLAEPMLRTFFEHGDFTARSAHLSALAMIAYAAGLPGYITMKITAAAFYANEDTITPVKVAVLALIVNVVASLIFIREFGHVGIAAGTAVAGWLNAGLQLWFIQRQGFIDLDLKKLAWPILKSLLLGAVILFLLLIYQSLFVFGEGFLSRFLWIGAAIVIGLVTFAVGAEVGKLFAVRATLRRVIGR